MKTIVVNATALDTSGALTILRQFIEAIPIDKDVEYIIFTSPIAELYTDNHHVHLVPIKGVKSLVRRFLWDALGLCNWLRKKNIVPAASISLQNTNFRTGYKIPNYIYYHQSIPFFKHRWSPFKTQERHLWFYKNIYPFFVKVFLNDRTQVFVQLKFIKDGFVKRNKINPDKIHIVRPQMNITHRQVEDIHNLNLDFEKMNLFYPATPFFYKNHQILCEALSLLDYDVFVLYFTCKKNQLNYNIPQNIHFWGNVTFEKVLDMYGACDGVLFPSYIETFGLPLIEAASAGCAIIAADLPYAREVLKGYAGVSFVPYDKPEKWAEAISNLKKGNRYPPLKLSDNSSWKYLFEILTNRLYENV